MRNRRTRLGCMCCMILLSSFTAPAQDPPPADQQPASDEPAALRSQATTAYNAKEFAKTVSEPTLRAELLKRMAEDQRIRTTSQPDIQEWRRIDADNTAYMKTVIDKHGWPGKTMVGSDGALAAFLMVQHADADPAFQKRCLKLLTRAAEKGEARAKDMAYLTDRVLVAEGKPQRYGTQFFSMPGLQTKPRPIEDQANLDARRKAVGLGPFADYLKLMRSMQQP